MNQSDIEAGRMLILASSSSAEAIKNVISAPSFTSASLNFQNQAGNTALMMAVARNKEDEAVAFTSVIMQRNDVDVNLQNLNGQTALHIICKKGYAALAKLLIARGAIVFVRDKDGKLAYDLCSDNSVGGGAVIRRKIRRVVSSFYVRTKLPQIFSAIEDNDIEKASKLIHSEPRLRSQSFAYKHPENGHTLVSLAVVWNRPEILKMLVLDNDKAVTCVDKRGRSLLACLSSSPSLPSFPMTKISREMEWGRRSLFKTLLLTNATYILNIVDKDGMNALMTAACEGRASDVKMILTICSSSSSTSISGNDNQRILYLEKELDAILTEDGFATPLITTTTTTGTPAARGDTNKTSLEEEQEKVWEGVDMEALQQILDDSFALSESDSSYSDFHEDDNSDADAPMARVDGNDRSGSSVDPAKKTMSGSLNFPDTEPLSDETISWLRLNKANRVNGNGFLSDMANRRHVSAYRYRGKPTELINHGDTALLFACRRGGGKYLPTITTLVEIGGANVNTAGSGGMTGLMWAACRNDYQTLKYLLQHGARINERAHCGRTALIWAIEAEHFSIAESLLHFRMRAAGEDKNDGSGQGGNNRDENEIVVDFDDGDGFAEGHHPEMGRMNICDPNITTEGRVSAVSILCRISKGKPISNLFAMDSSPLTVNFSGTENRAGQQSHSPDKSPIPRTGRTARVLAMTPPRSRSKSPDLLAQSPGISYPGNSNHHTPPRGVDMMDQQSSAGAQQGIIGSGNYDAQSSVEHDGDSSRPTSMRERVALLKLLINRGADLNRRSTDGHTALMWAVINSCHEMAHVLLISGADPDIPDAATHKPREMVRKGDLVMQLVLGVPPR